MSLLAFYAPLKSPNHANPSGDRTIARNITSALEFAGFRPDLVSELRSLDRTGNAATQALLFDAATTEIKRLIAVGRIAGWRAWITYHNYYKAPDLIGPAISKALSIPYVQIESTRARKRLVGPWAAFAKAAEEAAEHANTIFYFTQRDAIALKTYAPTHQHVVRLAPFLPQQSLPVPTDHTGSILTAAMMRPGDKLASYQLIADSLEHLRGSWHLTIAGDGPARPKVEKIMRPFGDQIKFMGLLGPEQMTQAYANARVFLWPGVNEAIGMVYLEAQAHGVPVVAQNRPGLIDVLAPSATYPDPSAGPCTLAKNVSHLLNSDTDPTSIQSYIEANHLLPAAAKTLQRGLSQHGVHP
ncbi:MAG: glycosyltransferase [Paracoccaceae bacterium]